MKIKMNETITLEALITFLSSAYYEDSWKTIKTLIVTLEKIKESNATK